jgi:thymidylate synthase ThyX
MKPRSRQGNANAALHGPAWRRGRRPNRSESDLDNHFNLNAYVTNPDRPVFALRNLPEEVVAVLFAYYSRSEDHLRDNLRKLLADGDVAVATGTDADDEAGLINAREKARKFHEKWVVGYGHGSVAEHAVVHLALEDVSILASKVIEDARLASYTEKSTRYVIFDEDSYYTPPALAGGPLGERYAETCRHLLNTYTRLMEPVTEQVKTRLPRTEKQTERGWNAACKAAACDVLRYLLPAATRTNIGLTANARTLEHLITKLMSDPLEECNALGADIKREAAHVAPTLIKYAERNDYMVETARVLQETAARIAPPCLTADWPKDRIVRLIHAPAEPDIELVTDLLYAYAGTDWGTLRDSVAALPFAERAAVLQDALRSEEKGGHRTRYDQPPRALEHLYYTFEILVDFGAYRDIQRHRMATQTRQPLTSTWGYVTPPDIAEFGLSDTFKDCMGRAADTYEAIAAEHPSEASYVLPLAYRMRALFTWNLRELHHFISLRSSRQGHTAYRRIAQDTWKALHAVHPIMADFIRVDMKDYDLAR